MKVGIAGAGIFGRLLAFALQNAGSDVTIVDQGGQDNCSQAAAGLLTHITELEKNDVIIYQLGKDALTQHWPSLFKQFDDQVYFRRLGSIVLSHPHDQSELKRVMRMITSKVSDAAVFQQLNQSQITGLEPQISKFLEGYYFPEEGQLDCQKTMSVLENKLTGIAWHKDTLVHDVSPGKIVLQDHTLNFDMVFDCRGLGAKSTFSDLRSVRGELIWLHAPEVIIHRPIRLMHPRYSLYVVPRPNQIYLIGASEIESNDQSSISVRAVLELLTAAYSIHPGFCEARMIKTVTHCRPTLADHLPKIKYTDDFAAINGLYRHGYLIAPSLVADVMRWIQHGVNAVNYPQLWEKYA